MAKKMYPEIEAEIKRRYPRLPKERNCAEFKQNRDERRNLLRIRLVKEKENKTT